MSVTIYDKALVAKIKKWTEKTNATILSPEDSTRLFEIISDENNDKPLQLPIIAISREGGYTINNTNKQPKTYGGMRLIADDETVAQLNVIPITLNYRIDVYCRYLNEADAYIREFIFNLINHPTIQIVVPYNGIDFPHNCTVYLNETVEDNSDIPERLIAGQFTRLSLRIYIDDAYLFDTSIKATKSIVSEGLIVFKQEGSDDYVIEKLFND